MSDGNAPPQPEARRSGPRIKAWNLLLLVPLLMLVTPWFNFGRPRLAGVPFFYWYQLLWVVVGVACVWIVYAMTRDKPGETPPVTIQESDVDTLDEGARE